MVEDALQFVATAGPLALAVMGFFVTLRPPGDLGRYIWSAAFFVVAIVSVVASQVTSKQQETHLESMLVGDKDDFPEIYGTSMPNGNLELFLSTGGSRSSLFDVSFAITRAGKFETIANRNAGTLIGGVALDTGVSLAPGNYQINFVARNGFFIEMLAIEKCKGTLAHAFSIYKPGEGGRVMRRAQYDPQCFIDVFPKEGSG